MVRGSKRSKSKPTKRSRRRGQSSRKRAVTSSNLRVTRSNIGSVVHKGVRSILGWLPGSAITQKVADIVFTALGFATKVSITGSSAVADTQFVGLCSSFFITPAMFMGDTIVGTSTSADTGSPDNGEIRKVSVNFSACRVSKLTIVARNGGPSTVHGDWGIGFWPFTSDQDEKSLAPVGKTCEIADIRQAPYYVEGPTSQTLRISHWFGTNNWYARVPGGYQRKIGLVAISMTDNIRSSYGNFTSSEFDPQISVNGTVICSTRNISAVSSFMNTVSTDSSVIASVRCNGRRYRFKNDDRYKCEHDATRDTCVISGTALTSVGADDPDLDEMDFCSLNP